MSYKSSILYDYPIAYYPLDEASGSTAFDYSGCENDSTYTGSVELNLIPLSVGCSRATKITDSSYVSYTIDKDYTAVSTTSKFATASSSDNDFTIELWFYPQISSTSLIPLMADSTEDVGIFYQKGNILFKLDTETVEYTLPSTNKAYHIAAVYSVNSAQIFIDGALVASKTLNNFKFTNTSLSLASGPTPASNSFLINGVTVYRYSLSDNQISYHFTEGEALPAFQIAEPLEGEIFEIYDNEVSSLYKFEYPNGKKWSEFVTTGLTHNLTLNCLEITETESAASSTITVEDFISIPSATLDSSKIEWRGDNGISIQASTDGTNYVNCINGQQIPGYTLNSFASSGKLHLRFIFSSTDTSRYIPRLFELSVLFYNDQTRYSYNGNSYISTLEEDAGISDYRITIGKYLYNILSRNDKNGLRTVVDSGFEITTIKGVQTLEFFYTPVALTASGLISTAAINGYAASNISWNGAGTMSKTNISAIYVNGVNKSSETNVSNIFRAEQLHHVLVVFGSAVSDDIRFNYSANGSVSALYQYIALYETAFNSTQAAANYEYYTKKQNVSVTDSSTLTQTEYGVEAYNNDWIVIQSV
jgi:hypothetical protein